MAKQFWEFVARGPRHQAAGDPHLQVEVVRDPHQTPAMIEAELVDLSRDGLQLRAPVPLAERETIAVKLRHAESGVDLTLPATVCWCRPQEDGTWSAGCASTERVDWESLGELFLGEILATDEPAS